MIGAILGDMVGAPYEFDRGDKTKDFEMWIPRARFTDDTVMTVAVAEALLSVGKDAAEEEVKRAVINAMQDWGERYPYAGYGGRFSRWLISPDPQPYSSWGNGSAMRVSSVGWLYDSIERTREVARWTAEVTHNHPEGVKGAESTASAIFMARKGCDKAAIKNYIITEFAYETVPEAITAFMEGNDFEDVIRTAVSLGGDCDTLTCIAGGMAEAYYGIPADMEAKTRERLKSDILVVLDAFDAAKAPRER